MNRWGRTAPKGTQICLKKLVAWVCVVVQHTKLLSVTPASHMNTGSSFPVALLPIHLPAAAPRKPQKMTQVLVPHHLCRRTEWSSRLLALTCASINHCMAIWRKNKWIEELYTSSLFLPPDPFCNSAFQIDKMNPFPKNLCPSYSISMYRVNEWIKTP